MFCMNTSLFVVFNTISFVMETNALSDSTIKWNKGTWDLTIAKQLDNKEVSVLLGLSTETKPEIKGTGGYKLSRKCLHMCPIKWNI
jgi:hypothetical protein